MNTNTTTINGNHLNYDEYPIVNLKRPAPRVFTRYILRKECIRPDVLDVLMSMMPLKFYIVHDDDIGYDCSDNETELMYTCCIEKYPAKGGLPYKCPPDEEDKKYLCTTVDSNKLYNVPVSVGYMSRDTLLDVLPNIAKVLVSGLADVKALPMECLVEYFTSDDYILKPGVVIDLEFDNKDDCELFEG